MKNPRTKPKLPWSYRPGDVRAERVLSYAQREGIDRSEAIHRLLDAGLSVADGSQAPADSIPAKPATDRVGLS